MWFLIAVIQKFVKQTLLNADINFRCSLIKILSKNFTPNAVYAKVAAECLSESQCSKRCTTAGI